MCSLACAARWTARGWPSIRSTRAANAGGEPHLRLAPTGCGSRRLEAAARGTASAPAARGAALRRRRAMRSALSARRRGSRDQRRRRRRRRATGSDERRPSSTARRPADDARVLVEARGERTVAPAAIIAAWPPRLGGGERRERCAAQRAESGRARRRRPWPAHDGRHASTRPRSRPSPMRAARARERALGAVAPVDRARRRRPTPRARTVEAEDVARAGMRAVERSSRRVPTSSRREAARCRARRLGGSRSGGASADPGRSVDRAARRRPVVRRAARPPSTIASEPTGISAEPHQAKRQTRRHDPAAPQTVSHRGPSASLRAPVRARRGRVDELDDRVAVAGERSPCAAPPAPRRARRAPAGRRRGCRGRRRATSPDPRPRCGWCRRSRRRRSPGPRRCAPTDAAASANAATCGRWPTRASSGRGARRPCAPPRPPAGAPQRRAGLDGLGPRGRGVGVTRQRRPRNSVGVGGLGPGALGAGHGVGADEPLGPAATVDRARHLRLGRADVGDQHLGVRPARGRAPRAPAADRAHRHRQEHDVGAAHRVAGVRRQLVDDAAARARARRRAGSRSQPIARVTAPACPQRQRERAADVPAADQRQPVRVTAPPPAPPRSRCVLLGGPDGDAQVVRQAEAPQRPHDHAPPQQRLVDRRALAAGRSTSTKLACDGVHLEAELGEARRSSARSPRRVGAARAHDVLRRRRARRSAASCAERVTLNGMPHAVQVARRARVGDAVADAQPGQPVGLGEGAQR